MTVSLIIIGCILCLGVPLYIHERRYRKKHAGEEQEPQKEPEQCCGLHADCEKTSLVATSVSAPVYYEDEDLDSFAGREPESYSDEETEQFRDVLLSLLPEDAAGWARSLQQRGIQLPTDVREELLMIVDEQRRKAGV